MQPVDGNAIAGIMHDLLARDMTMMGYNCPGCGRTGVMAEMSVFMAGPGVVARCRDCDTILLMLSERRGMHCIDLPGGTPTLQPSPL